MKNSIYKSLSSVLSRAQKILVVGGQNLSIDSASSMLALYDFLVQDKKEVTLVAEQKLPEKINFLCNGDKFSRELSSSNDFIVSICADKDDIANVEYKKYDDHLDIIVSSVEEKINKNQVSFSYFSGDFDLIITVGVNNLEETGNIFIQNPKLFTSLPIINISASIENEFFAKINLVDSSASSACEIITNYLRFVNYKFNKNIATTLLTGILSATESFLSHQTTAGAFRCASELQVSGANHSQIINHLFKEKTFSNLKVLGQILNNLQFDSIHQMSWSTMSKSDLELVEASPRDIDHWADQILRHIDGSSFIILFVEDEKNCLVQIRYGEQNIDFSDFYADKDNEYQIKKSSDPHGMDFVFIGSTIPEIQTDFLKKLARFQEQRLNIKKNQKIVRTELRPVQTKNILSSSADSLPNNQKKVPKNLPFATEKSSSELSDDIKNINPTSPTSKKDTSKVDENLPQWMK